MAIMLVAVVLGAIAGLVTGGSLGNLARLPLRWWPLLLAATAIELTLGEGDAPGYFRALQERLAPTDVLTVKDRSGILLTQEPKQALSALVELGQTRAIQFEWLNIRKNTLEDVFLNSVEPGGENHADP